MLKAKFYLFSLSLIWLILAPMAVANTNFYQTQVSMTGQQALDDVLRQAMKQVLVKISSNPEIDQVASIQTAINNAKDYVQSYQYLATDAQGIRQLLVSFNANGIKQLLRKANQPIWTGPRPSILVWLVYQSDSGQRQFITPDVSVPIINLSGFSQDAKNFGYPIIWPALDLTDITNLPTSAVALLNPELIQNASARYSAEVVLAGIIRGNEQHGWQTQWLLLTSQGQKQMQFSGNELSQLFQQLFNQISQQFQRIYAGGGADAENTSIPVLLSVRVSNIQNLNDFARVSAFLKNLTSVTQVQPLSVGSDEMSLDVTVLGGASVLLRELGSENAAVTEPIELIWQGQKLIYSGPSQDEVNSEADYFNSGSHESYLQQNSNLPDPTYLPRHSE